MTPIFYIHHKRRSIYCALLFVLPLFVIAQEAEEPTRGIRHAIGLNTAGLLDRVIDDSEEDRFKTPYLIAYSIELGKLAVRAAVGPEYSSETIVHDGFSDSEENTLLRLDGRVGVGLIVLEDHRWQAIAGVDATGGYFRDRQIEDSGFDRITTQVETETFGAGPFIQVDFHVSKRISLGAESAIYWQQQKTTHAQLFENFPDFNNVLSENSGPELEITLPNTIFIRLHF